MSGASPDTPEFIGVVINDKDGALKCKEAGVGAPLILHPRLVTNRDLGHLLISSNLSVLIFEMRINVLSSQDCCED